MDPTKFRVVVVGDTAVGKTQVVKYLSNPGLDGDTTFNATFDAEHTATLGAEMCEHTLTVEVDGVGEGSVTLDLIDCGGEEQYQKMNKRWGTGKRGEGGGRGGRRARGEELGEGEKGGRSEGRKRRQQAHPFLPPPATSSKPRR